MASKAIAARLAATQILHGVLFDKRVMAEILQGPHSPIERLGPADRARAQALATGTLRYLGRIDAILDGLLDKRPQPRAMQALRLASYEMLADGGAAHGAVNAAVEIVRGSAKAGHLAGLVNAVARKVAQTGPEIWAQQTPQPLPSWLARPITKNFGAPARLAIEAAHERGAAIDLTLKSPDRAGEFSEKLDAVLLPQGSLRLRGRPQISALDGFDTGDWWVQDAAAAMPARLLGDVTNKRVLDLCAAPGGKTMQLAAAGAKVTALDQSEGRLVRLHENLKRVGLTARVITADALTWQDNGLFDAILLDAPCSATGTIRRHPDLPFAKAGVDLSGLFDLQAAMIDAAVGRLKPGGKLVYCTCSLLPREGETQIERALDRHGDLAVLRNGPSVPGLDDDWHTAEGGWRLRPDYLPDLGGIDGFYMALMEKTPKPQ